MERKTNEYLLRSICLLAGVSIVSENFQVCSHEKEEDRTNIRADTILTYPDYPTDKLYIHNSRGTKKLSNLAIVLFFGGGWNSGPPKQFEPQARYLMGYGITVVLADYRIKNNTGTTPKEALMDIKSIMCFSKKNAIPLCIDPEKILAGGGPVGGHLVATTAFRGNINYPKDDPPVSLIPKVLILFNSVVDNSLGGYRFNRVKDYYENFPPIRNIKKNAPPTILSLGAEGSIISAETTQEFEEKMEVVSARRGSFPYIGQRRGPLNSRHRECFEKTMVETVTFLKSLGYIGD